MMELLELFATGVDSVGKADFWVQVDATDNHLACIVFGHVSDRGVLVAFDGKLLKGSDGEESEQMAAGKRGYEGLLGIDAIGVSQVLGGGGSI